MSSKKLVTIIVVLVVIASVYFLLKGIYQAPAPTQPQTPTDAPTQEVIEETSIKELNVVGTEFSFSPSRIKVQAGEQVKITFKNNGRAPHNLVIEGLDIGTKTIGGGQTDIIEFTASSSGNYTFFCSVPGHRASGMEGQVIVE